MQSLSWPRFTPSVPLRFPIRTRLMDEDVLIAGDDRKAKDDVAALIDRIPGLRPIDCGDLEMARIIEQLTPLLISINKRHKIKHSGIRITGLDTAAD